MFYLLKNNKALNFDFFKNEMYEILLSQPNAYPIKIRRSIYFYIIFDKIYKSIGIGLFLFVIIEFILWRIIDIIRTNII